MKNAKATDRYSHMAMAAARMAIEEAQLPDAALQSERAAIILGTAFGGSPAPRCGKGASRGPPATPLARAVSQRPRRRCTHTGSRAPRRHARVDPVAAARPSPPAFACLRSTRRLLAASSSRTDDRVTQQAEVAASEADGNGEDGFIIKRLGSDNFRCISRSAHFQVRQGRQYIHF